MSLDKASVTAWMIRSDESTVTLQGTAEGSVARIRLAAACYRCEGRFSLIIKAVTPEETAALFWGEGTVTRTSTQTMVDPEHIVPDLPQLLRQIAVMEAAMAAGSAAAEAAETAAEGAQRAAADANGAADRAKSGAQAAERAAQQVTDALIPEIAIGTVETLEAGEAASAAITGTLKRPLLNLGIPKGRDGADGGASTALPTASREEKGCVRVGDGLTIHDAVLSVPVMRAPGVDDEFGAYNGYRGLVPDPAYADREKFLRGDGTWQTPAAPGDLWQLRTKSAVTDTGIAAGSEGTLTAAADVLEGYTPAGVVSYQLMGTGASWCTVYRVSFGSGTVSVGIRNQHGSKTFSPSCSVGILYLRE